MLYGRFCRGAEASAHSEVTQQRQKFKTTNGLNCGFPASPEQRAVHSCAALGAEQESDCDFPSMRKEIIFTPLVTGGDYFSGYACRQG